MATLSTRRRGRVLIFGFIACVLIFGLSNASTRFASEFDWRPRCLFSGSSSGSTCRERQLSLDGIVVNDGQLHIFSPDGLLQVNPAAQTHPIEALIAQANSAWAHKLSLASPSLLSASLEYQRRYNQSAPKGFDAWWRWAVEENNVQLPDEYDHIAADFAPFRSISPSDLRRLISFRGNYSQSGIQTVRIGKLRGDDTEVKVLEYGGPMRTEAERKMAEGFKRSVEGNYAKLLQPVAHLLPAFEILVSPHDSPPYVMEWERREQFVKAGQRGEYVEIEEGFTGPFVATSYPLTCPPDSPARSPLTPAPHVPQMKTFVHAHGPSSNPCIHPSLLALSTPFLSTTGPPRPPRGGVPIPSLTHSLGCGGEGIRVGSLYGFFEGDSSEGDDGEGYEGEIPWEEREDTLIWRGSTTGARFQEDSMWRESQRVRIVALANGVQLDTEAESISPSSDEIVDVIDPLWSGSTTITNNTLSIPLSTLRSSLSISFTNPPGPIQCSPDTCTLLREMFDFVPSMASINVAGKKGKGTEGGYRYLLDVDGNAWSGRFNRLLASGALIFKATVYEEWFAHRVQPWVHYIPLGVEYSEFWDVLGFFRGVDGVEHADIAEREGAASGRYGAHDDIAQRIAQQGREWRRQFWRKEDLTAYLFRVMLEYIRLTSDDRESPSASYGHRST